MSGFGDKIPLSSQELRAIIRAEVRRRIDEEGRLSDEDRQELIGFCGRNINSPAYSIIGDELLHSDFRPFILRDEEPPRSVQRALWLLLPAKDRDAILGDALEAYHDTLRKFGRATANYDYAKEVFYAIIAAGWQRALQVLSVWRRGQ